MPLLNETAFRETFARKMVRVIGEDKTSMPFWSYVEQIPKEDFKGFDCSEGKIQWIYHTEPRRFEHVVINTKEDKDIFMVVVLDLINNNVLGHRLTDFNSKSGLNKP